MRKISQHLVLAAALTLISSLSYGWGYPGHEAIGIIAEQNLKPKARAEIKKLLKNESMASASLWPDKIRYSSGWTHTRPFHFVSIADREDYFDSLRNSDSRNWGDVVQALLKAEDMLRSSKTTMAEKANALKFMIHMVGDLHQPLHVGRAEDAGGNAIEMTWFNRKTNLHAVWDVYMISTFVSRIKSKIELPLNGQSYVEGLRQPTQREISKWEDSYIMTWLEESKDNRSNVYTSIKYSSENYYKRNNEYLNTRVLQAGHRLAAWLNSIFSGRSFMPDESHDLRSELESILGKNYLNLISLNQSSKLSVFDVYDFEDPCEHHEH